MEKIEIEEAILTLPDLCAKALFQWRRATAIAKKMEGVCHIETKKSLLAKGARFTTDDLRAMVKADEGCYKSALEEAGAEAVHARLYERLMSIKKLADVRTAY
jgi:hypothetical protein